MSRKHNGKTPGILLKRCNKPGDLRKLQQKLWRAVVASEALLLADGVNFDDQVRAIHALVQAGGAYAKLLEATDLQEQLDTLKQEVAHLRGQMPLRKVS